MNAEQGDDKYFPKDFFHFHDAAPGCARSGHAKVATSDHKVNIGKLYQTWKLGCTQPMSNKMSEDGCSWLVASRT